MGFIAKTAVIPLALCLSVPAFARWAEPDEADSAIENLVVHVKVEKNLESRTEDSLSVRILKDGARQRWGTVRYNYSPQNTAMKILKASTKNGTTITELGRDSIVDAPISIKEQGFDEQRRISAAFAEIEVGSEVRLQTESKTFRPLYGEFSRKYSLGEASVLKSAEFSFDSKVPLFFEKNDPTEALELKDESKDGGFRYTVRLRKPVYQKVVEEENPYLPESAKTWFVVSSKTDYKDFYAKTARAYEDILAKPLPPALEKIAAEARLKTSSMERINSVTSQIAEQFRYMGDWRSVEGGYIPHSLEEIVKVRYGDCKDFSVLLAATLRKLGFDAQVAFIFRGRLPVETPRTAFSGGFNHAVVTVLLENQKRLWLDGTNFQSDAEGIPEDLAARQALILNQGLVDVGQGASERNERRSERTHVRTGKETVRIVGRYLFAGRMANLWIGQELRSSRQQLENRFLDQQFRRAEVIEAQVKLPPLKNRVIEDVVIEANVHKYLKRDVSSLGPAIRYKPLELDELLKIDGKTRVSHFNLGRPAVYVVEDVFDRYRIQGRSITDCKIESPALDYSVTVKYLKDGFKAVSTAKLKKMFLEPAEMKTPQFADFMKKLRDCAGDKSFVYR